MTYFCILFQKSIYSLRILCHLSLYSPMSNFWSSIKTVWHICMVFMHWYWCLSLFKFIRTVILMRSHLLKGALNIEIRGNIISKVGRSTPLFTVFLINSKWIYNYENNTTGYYWEYICQIQSPPAEKTTIEDCLSKPGRRETTKNIVTFSCDNKIVDTKNNKMIETGSPCNSTAYDISFSFFLFKNFCVVYFYEVLNCSM